MRSPCAISSLSMPNSFSPSGFRTTTFFKRDENPRMGAAIGEFDLARSFLVRGAQILFDRLRAAAELLGFPEQQIAAAVDADILQLAGILPQPLHLPALLVEAARLRVVVLGQKRAGRAIGVIVQTRTLRPQKQRPVVQASRKSPVVAGDHHRDLPSRRGDPCSS